MKKVLGILCIIAIIINIYFVVFIKESQKDLSDEEVIKPLDEVIPVNFTVTVPEKRLGDLAQYDYTIFAELYEENISSGEWERYTLKASGQLIDEIAPDIVKAKDGFNMKHSTVAFQEITTATFEIIINGSDKEKLTAHGELDVSRTEYTDIYDKDNKITIQTSTSAEVSVDPLANIPAKTNFDGYMRNYPNPNLVPEETLDENIYLKNQKLGLNDNDSILKMLDSDEQWVSEWLTQRYNWTVESAEKVVGYDTLLINISTGFFKGFINFEKKVWIANEVSFPVKVFVRTNSSWDGKDENGYFELIHTRILQDKTNNFIQGSKDIPWETCEAPLHFHEKHPRGEFLDWKNETNMPKAGAKYDESSFHFDPQVAEEYALEHSTGLNQLINKFGDVVVDWGIYNAEKDLKDPQRKAGTYNWNLSFGYKPTSEEFVEAWESGEEAHWGYYVNLTRNLTKEPGIDRYSEEIKIINEGAYDWGSSPLAKDDLDDDVLTLASSEEILKLEDDVVSEVYSQIDDEINFQNTFFALGMGDFTTTNMPGMEIIETITGITLPKSKYSWILHKGGILFTSGGGELFSAAVDVETGQLLYVMKIDGTDLYSILAK